MSAGTQEPLAVARVTAFLDVRDAAPKRPVILGSIRANVIEEREGKVLFSDDLRFLLSALTAPPVTEEMVERAAIEISDGVRTHAVSDMDGGGLIEMPAAREIARAVLAAAGGGSR